MDNSSEFGAIVSELIRQYGINHIKISPYNSRVNGIIKQGHYPLWEVLLKCGERETNWVHYFDHALWCEQARIRHDIGYLPHYLVYGYEPLLPIDAAMRTFVWTPGPKSTEELLVDHIHLLKDKEQYIDIASAQVAQTRWKRMECFNREHQHTMLRNPIVLGDLVLVQNSAIDTSLD
jgi:hypothetical protein